MLEALRIELKHWQETPGPDATLVVRRLKQLIREKEIEKILRDLRKEEK